ncbi:hypothetical protein Tsubulata_034826 [Turnera subulata]|uniref:Fructose-2,6-bisphosphatase n=1 Tax=Turnera subulata TaxID=218843 RepID=A0A9Q0J1Y0_9ROSI|nr:hypothetical protein Tsubulata_034826 [Turnera subulata]
MGSTQSVQVADEDEDSEEEEEEEDEEEEVEKGETEQGEEEYSSIHNTHNHHHSSNHHNNLVIKKVLEQEPEMLPCHSSASPLSPQLSSLGTPRLGPSIKVWDPYNVLAPPPLPPPPPPPHHHHQQLLMDDDHRSPATPPPPPLEVFLISHGECDLNLTPDLIGGRCHQATLTPNGKRQARALAVFLNSQGVCFNAVYSSPLDRARSMAVSVCREMNFAEEQIQSSDALAEMSLGHWEGCPRSEIFTPEIQSMVESLQPDFCAPSGESLRQVEFRMVQFLNETVLGLPDKLRTDLSLQHQNESQVFSHDRDGSSLQTQQHWDNMLHRHRQGLSRKKSGKSRLQIVSTTENHEGDYEISPRDANHQNSLHDLNVRSSSSSLSSCIGIFTHAVPIKCLLTGLLGCSPIMSHKICIEDSSVTVLQHSWRTGWQIKRLNDSAHLRLL